MHSLRDIDVRSAVAWNEQRALMAQMEREEQCRQVEHQAAKEA
jgi:hypothetical protein